jgi:hypothetical protein
MIDTLLLRPSLHYTTLHPTALHSPAHNIIGWKIIKGRIWSLMAATSLNINAVLEWICVLWCSLSLLLYHSRKHTVKIWHKKWCHNLRAIWQAQNLLASQVESCCTKVIPAACNRSSYIFKCYSSIHRSTYGLVIISHDVVPFLICCPLFDNSTVEQVVSALKIRRLSESQPILTANRHEIQ